MKEHPPEKEPSEKVSEDKEPLANEGVAQLQIAQTFFPEMGETDAMIKFSQEGYAKQFRTILEDNESLKKRIDEGDEGAIDEIEEMLSS